MYTASKRGGSEYFICYVNANKNPISDTNKYFGDMEPVNSATEL